MPCSVNIEYTIVSNKQITSIMIQGLFERSTIGEISEIIKSTIPFDFEGNVILDISETDDRITDDDVPLVAEKLFLGASRYFFRRPFAIVDGGKPSLRSKNIIRTVLDREGLTGKKFDSQSEAINWLKTVD